MSQSILRKKCSYSELLGIQRKYGEMRTKITPNTDTFLTVVVI